MDSIGRLSVLEKGFLFYPLHRGISCRGGQQNSVYKLACQKRTKENLEATCGMFSDNTSLLKGFWIAPLKSGKCPPRSPELPNYRRPPEFGPQKSFSKQPRTPAQIHVYEFVWQICKWNLEVLAEGVKMKLAIYGRVCKCWALVVEVCWFV